MGKGEGEGGLEGGSEGRPEKPVKYSYVPLWALLPAIKSGEAAEGYLREGHRWLGRPLNEKEKAYLLDTIEQGKRVKEWLRKLGYFDDTPRGKLLRTHGISVETDDDAEKLLKELEEKET